MRLVLFCFFVAQPSLEGADAGAEFTGDLTDATRSKEQDDDDQHNEQFSLSEMEHGFSLSVVVPLFTRGTTKENVLTNKLRRDSRPM